VLGAIIKIYSAGECRYFFHPLSKLSGCHSLRFDTSQPVLFPFDANCASNTALSKADNKVREGFSCHAEY
jgi:hypothetical protein